jgi:hypothetical protein
MSAWTKFATQFFHNKQKNDPDYKFSQALKQASPLFKKMKKGGSRKQQGGGVGEETKYTVDVKDGIETIVEDPNGMTLKELRETLEVASDDLKKQYNTLQGVTNMLPVISVSETKIKVQKNGDPVLVDGKTVECDPTSSEYNTSDCMPPLVNNENIERDIQDEGDGMTTDATETGMQGGKKSKRKSKKAGKKSQKKQKKAKKAGSKKCKK